MSEMHIGIEARKNLKQEKVEQTHGIPVHEAVQIQPTKVVKSLKSINADELHQIDLAQPTFTIEGIMPTGLITFAARPKTGKSWLCLDIADAVASGRQFWNRRTKQGDVLYLALEDSEYRIKERLKQIGSSFPKSLHFVTKGAESLDNGFIEQIRNWETEHNAPLQLLIIDTIVRIKGASKRGKNANESDTEQYAPLQALALEKGFSVVCVTHYSKNKFSTDPFEAISGSTALFAVSDASWVITGDRNDASKRLVITGRDIGSEELCIEFSNCKWKLIGNSEEMEQKRLDKEYAENPIVKTINKLLSEGDYWTGTTSQLTAEVVRLTGYDLGQPNQATKKIRAIILELRRRDNIITSIPNSNGGKKGRLFTFARKN